MQLIEQKMQVCYYTDSVGHQKNKNNNAACHW